MGLGNLVTNDATPGTTVVDTTKCLIDWIEYMHKRAGARNFLFMNVRFTGLTCYSPLMMYMQQMIPLSQTILYGPNGYPWAFYNKPFDAQAWTTFIQNVVPASNAMADAWLRDLAPKLRGSHIGEWQWLARTRLPSSLLIQTLTQRYPRHLLAIRRHVPQSVTVSQWYTSS